MKKTFLFTFLICGSLARLIAQDRMAASVDSLISSKHFAFVVTEMESRPIYRNSYEFSDVPSVNPELMNLSMLAQTEIAKGKSTNMIQANYVAQINTDHNYYNAYGISQYPKNNDRNHRTKVTSVYIVQMPDGVLISGDKMPTKINELQDNDFYAYQEKDSKLNIVQRDNNRWELTYTVGKGKDKRNFEIEVLANGKATLKATPSGDHREYLYGYITDPASLEFNK